MCPTPNNDTPDTAANGSANIGHNSGNPDDPGPASDFPAIDGPLALRADLCPKKVEAFCEAIRSQGNESVRQAAITNAMARWRANPNIPHLAYRILEQIASRCRWHYRYYFESKELLAFFTGLGGAQNLARTLQLLCQLGA